MEPHEYDDLLRRLDERDDHIMAMLDEQRVFNRQQLTVNERLTAAIERLDVTQARIEALLARMLQQGTNGHEA